MIYKNYISGKNLSRLDIYISTFFLLVFIITVGRFFYSSSYYYCLGGFFVNYGGVLMQIVIFVF